MRAPVDSSDSRFCKTEMTGRQKSPIKEMHKTLVGLLSKLNYYIVQLAPARYIIRTLRVELICSM